MEDQRSLSVLRFAYPFFRIHTCFTYTLPGTVLSRYWPTPFHYRDYLPRCSHRIFHIKATSVLWIPETSYDLIEAFRLQLLFKAENPAVI